MVAIPSQHLTAASPASFSAHFLEPIPGGGDIIVEAFYGQGPRFIDVSDLCNPVQVGYLVPDGGRAATPAFHHGLVYAAQYSTGIDVLRFTRPGGRGSGECSVTCCDWSIGCSGWPALWRRRTCTTPGP